MIHLMNLPQSTVSRNTGASGQARSTMSKHSGVMRAMFAARKSVFVDLLKWDVPVLDGQYELDQFDNEHAIYLIHTDHHGNHRASARLLPTTRPHILDSFYSKLCREGPPRGLTTFEITRFCLDRSLRAADRRKARDRLVRGLVDYALAHDITTYTAIAQPGWGKQILAFGWRAALLGEIQRIGPDTLAALRIDINADTPNLLAKGGIGQSIEPTCERPEAANENCGRSRCHAVGDTQ